MPRIQIRITGSAWPGVITAWWGTENIWELWRYFTESQQWHSQALDTHTTPAWHWHAIRNWFSALGSTSISQSLFWDMFGIIITKFSRMYSLRWALCLCVLGRMLTWVPSLAGMYQVSPRHHYVCIFTNVKILHNMSGTDRDTPSAHPLPGSQGT